MGHLLRLNHEPPSVIVVDDFYTDPHAVREFALEQTFVEHVEYHKGKRTDKRFLTDEIKAQFGRLLGQTVTNWSEYPINGCFQMCQAGDQQVFHADEQTRAAVVYLTPDAPLSGGTSFYRDRKYRLRKAPTQADADRLSLPVHLMLHDMFQGHLLDSTKWEAVDTVGNVFNRLVIWDAKLVHAAGDYFGNSPGTCRLFHLFFFDCE